MNISRKLKVFKFTMWPTFRVKLIFALVICTEMHIYVRAEWNSSETTDFQTKPEQQTYGLYIERLENVIQKQFTIIENLQKVVSQHGNRIGRLENISRNNDGNNQATSGDSSLHLSQRIDNAITHQGSTMSKRFLTPGQYNIIAFHSYLASNLQYQYPSSKGSTVIFQNTGLNVGNHYNQLTGIFTAPVQGTFVFTWTITVTDEGYLNTELVRNMESIGAIYTSAVGVKNARTSTGVVVGDVTIGDNVYVRFSTTNSGTGEIVSVSSCKSTFSGWRLF